MEKSAIDIVLTLLTFAVVAFIANFVGKGFKRIGLPLISGCILTGVIAGPFCFGVIDKGDVELLHFVDFTALAFIAFVTGAELHLRLLKSRLRSILIVLLTSIITVMLFTLLAVRIALPYIPFMATMSLMQQFAVSLLCATVLIAISPSTVIAVIRDLRAKGTFTQTVMGVTVLMDVVVIFAFAITSTVADVVFQGAIFDLRIILFLLFEILMNVVFGVALGQLIRIVLHIYPSENLSTRTIHSLVHFKGALILLIGYGVFTLSSFLRGVGLAGLPIPVFSEPMLICLVSGLYIANSSPYTRECEKVIEDVSPITFLLFFTLLGTAIQLDFLQAIWVAVLILLVARFIGMLVGGYLATTLGGLPAKKRLLGLAFVTQAGIGLSLAEEIELEFGGWGEELATLIIAVIVLNTVIGPPFLKYALERSGEAGQRRGKRNSSYIFSRI